MTRKQLAIAISKRNDAKSQLADLQSAHQRAEELVAQLGADIDQHRVAQNDHASATATGIVAQLLQGISVDLAAHQPVGIAEKLAAEAKLKVAVSAREQLTTQVTRQEQLVENADGVVRQLAIPIMVTEAETLAAEIECLEAQLYSLRTNLRGLENAEYILATTTSGQWQKAQLLTPRVVHALQPFPEPQWVGGQNPAAEFATRWRDHFAALTADAQASL